MPPDDIAKAHRWFAVECNNRAWDLIAKPARTPAEVREMLLAAHAAAYHWSHAGTPLNAMRADIVLAHVHALLGHGAKARQFAEASLRNCESSPCEDWDVAFAYLEMALAAWAAGDAMGHRNYYELATSQCAAIKDDEDRKVFQAELLRIDAPSAWNTER